MQGANIRVTNSMGESQRHNAGENSQTQRSPKMSRVSKVLHTRIAQMSCYRNEGRLMGRPFPVEWASPTVLWRMEYNTVVICQTVYISITQTFRREKNSVSELKRTNRYSD